MSGKGVGMIRSLWAEENGRMQRACRTSNLSLSREENGQVMKFRSFVDGNDFSCAARGECVLVYSMSRQFRESGPNPFFDHGQLIFLLSFFFRRALLFFMANGKRYDSSSLVSL